MSAAIAMGVLSVGALVELALAEVIRSRRSRVTRVTRRRPRARVTGMVKVSGRVR